jgi:PAS domain S-box-containing protein
VNAVDNRRILLIDDTPAIHEDFRKILVEKGGEADLNELETTLFGAKPVAAPVRFELDSAFQGEEGLALLAAARERGEPYALAFVDMRMPPGWDGVETIEHLWREDPRLQVVICTAYSDYSWEEVLERLEVGDRLLVLKKPFDAVEVSQLAKTLTAKWQLARQAELKLAALEEAVRRRTEQLASSNEVLLADIVERKRAEQETMEAYRRMADILEFLPDATFVVDAQGKVIAWNRAIEVMTGIGKADMLNQDGFAYAIPFYGERRRILIDLLDEEQETLHRLYPGIRREAMTVYAEARVLLAGEVRFLWSSATPLYDTQGSKVGAIQSLRDITELRRVEQERSRLEAQLQHAGMMESLMAQLGHDLKTPLTPLFALLPLVRRQVSDPKLHRMLDICQASVNQIQGLSSKALDLVRLSCREKPLQQAPIPLASTVDSCIGACGPLFVQRGITCLNEVDEGIVVQAAADQLNLLLDNLLSNSARYAALDGTVRIRAELEPGGVVVSVQDDGVGLKPGQGALIFEEFFKADAARHDLDTQGLGLAICKRIVLNHKGRIWAESPGPGQGTTIRFTLKQAKTT